MIGFGVYLFSWLTAPRWTASRGPNGTDHLTIYPSGRACHVRQPRSFTGVRVDRVLAGCEPPARDEGGTRRPRTGRNPKAEQEAGSARAPGPGPARRSAKQET